MSRITTAIFLRITVEPINDLIMKRFVFFILCVAIPVFGTAQNTGRLSEAGNRHRKTAATLLELAANTDDLVAVTAELEEILKTDPNYSDAYYNLGQLYMRIGKDKGEVFFEKAKNAFSQYLKIRPADSLAVKDDLYTLEMVRKSSEKSRSEADRKRFVGTWKVNYEVAGMNYPLYFIVDDFNGSFSVVIKSTFDKNWEQIADYTEYSMGALSFSYEVIEDRKGATWQESSTGWSVTCDKERMVDKWTFYLKEDGMGARNKQDNYYYLRGRLVDHKTSDDTFLLYK